MPYLSSAASMTAQTTASPLDAPFVEARSGEYSVAPLTARIIRVVIGGFWTAPVMDDFVRDVTAAVGALPCAPEEHMVLCDISHSAIQSRSTFAAFLSLLTEMPVCSRRVAFVSNNPISRMQARRLMASRTSVALFEDEASALRWLTTAG